MCSITFKTRAYWHYTGQGELAREGGDSFLCRLAKKGAWVVFIPPKDDCCLLPDPPEVFSAVNATPTAFG